MFLSLISPLGGGLASDEHQLHLPVNMNDLDSLRPHLNFLAHLYSISVVGFFQINKQSDLFLTQISPFASLRLKTSFETTCVSINLIDDLSFCNISCGSEVILWKKD